MAKKTQTMVKLESSAGTGYYYMAERNPRNTPEKLKKKKFDPRAVIEKTVINEKTGKEEKVTQRGAHVLFEEKKNKFK